MNAAVITLARGRHDHLRKQAEALAATPPADYVVVSLGDPDLSSVLTGIDHRLIEIAVPPSEELPLAAARNAGAAAAIGNGADLLVFLDVDCIPSPGLLPSYAAAAAHRPDALLCGAVGYLPPAPPTGYDLASLVDARPHAARPAPPPGEVWLATDRRLFWSLSFAVTAENWRRTGGFCERYVGYGGEDTDFAETAHAAGIDLYWVGGAMAYHQHHPVSAPPVEHLQAILRNGRLFAQRWGWWPMSGWLEAFADRGLVRFDEVQGWVAL